MNSQKSLIIYKAIVNSYDGLWESQSLGDEIDFILFSDDLTSSAPWRLNRIVRQYEDPTRDARRFKVLSHRFLSNYAFSLWVDGTIELLPFKYQSLIDEYLHDSDLATFRHSVRNCIYDEANICAQYTIDDTSVIYAQMQRYRQLDYPTNNGLVETNVILRRHNRRVREFNEVWWNEILRGSRRDQLSFNYAIWKTGLKYRTFADELKPNAINSPFKTHAHARSRSEPQKLKSPIPPDIPTRIRHRIR